MKSYDVIILGCGASGTMCAVSTKAKKIAVVDFSNKVAKKLLLTGNGRCNLTNLNVDSSAYNVKIDDYLKRFDNTKTLEFFENIGLEHYADEEGRVYPISNSAKSVVDVLNEKMNNADLYLGEKIVSVCKNSDEFIVKTDKSELKAKKLVVTTGGNSTKILNDLNVPYKKFIPSLVALKSKNTRDLNGVKVSNVLVKAKCKNISKKEIGEVLFKEDGLSGIVIFNLSSLFAREGDFSGEIEIDLLPKFSEKKLFEKLNQRKKLGLRGDKFFFGMFQNAVANEIFKQAKVNTNKNSKDFTDVEIERICEKVKGLNFEVCGHYDNNQVFSGGVELNDLTENLESKKIKNLFFCGEIVDVDGVCGGFNLQWAWTSGHIVGGAL